MKQLQEIVQQVGVEHGFLAVVLTDASGFPLAASTGGEQAEAPAAIAARVQRVAQQASAHVGLGEMDEIVMFDEHGQRLVCRAFAAGERTLILVVKLAAQTAYRRATNQAIRQIQRVWAQRDRAA